MFLDDKGVHKIWAKDNLYRFFRRKEKFPGKKTKDREPFYTTIFSRYNPNFSHHNLQHLR
jgi:hypothetical protein